MSNLPFTQAANPAQNEEILRADGTRRRPGTTGSSGRYAHGSSPGPVEVRRAVPELLVIIGFGSTFLVRLFSARWRAYALLRGSRSTHRRRPPVLPSCRRGMMPPHPRVRGIPDRPPLDVSPAYRASPGNTSITRHDPCFTRRRTLSLAVWLLKGFIDEITREYEGKAALHRRLHGWVQAFYKIVLPQAANRHRLDRDLLPDPSPGHEHAPSAVLLTSRDGGQTATAHSIPTIIGAGGAPTGRRWRRERRLPVAG